MKPKPKDLDLMREQILERGGDPNDFPILRDESRPKLFRDVRWVWEGFTALSGSRQMGYASIQPLLLSEILAYLDYRGIQDLDDREEFIYLVQSMDRRVVAEAIAKSQAQTRSKTPQQPPKRPR